MMIEGRLEDFRLALCAHNRCVDCLVGARQ